MTSMKDLTQIKQAIRDRYAWPGGYPLFLVCNDGAALCVDCGRSEFQQVAVDTALGWRTGWDVAAPAINFEDADLICDHCNESIESAYGDSPCLD